LATLGEAVSLEYVKMSNYENKKMSRLIKEEKLLVLMGNMALLYVCASTCE
jgi:hypothetical protein